VGGQKKSQTDDSISLLLSLKEGKQAEKKKEAKVTVRCAIHRPIYFTTFSFRAYNSHLPLAKVRNDTC
jgi:hypothetical protein